MVGILVFLEFFNGVWGGDGGSASSAFSGRQERLTVSLDTASGSAGAGQKTVSRSPMFVLRFSAPVEPSSVNPNNIKLFQRVAGQDIVIPLSNMTADPTQTRFAFSVAQYLAQGEYTLVVYDIAGDTTGTTAPRRVLQQFHFTVQNGNNAPNVAIISPDIHSKQISTVPSLQLRFSEAVQNVNGNTIGLHEGSRNGPLVPVGSLIAGADNTFTFSSPGGLKKNTTYCLVVSEAITDSAGHPLFPMDFCFETSTLGPPEANLTTPSDNAQNVPLHPTIQLQFSAPVQNANANTITLHEGGATGPTVLLNSLVAGANNTYTFSPQQALKPLTQYTLVLGAGITDTATGLPMQERHITFTTESGSSPVNPDNPADTTSPTVNLVAPSNNATNVSTNPSIQLVFSEAVQNVNASTVTLHAGSASGPVVALNPLTAGASNTYTVSPSSALNQQTLYYLVLSSGISDSSGNALAPTRFSFTTGDFTNPSVSLLTPSNNATGVSLNPSIQLQFSEAVLNVNSSITLREGSPTGSVVAIATPTPGANNTYTLSPSAALQQQTLYYVVLSNAITDSSGNALTPTTLSFTTGDFTAPTVTMVTPSNNDTGVALTPTITLQFSEAVLNVNSSTVSLRKGSTTGSVVATSAVTAGANNTYTFSPTAALDSLATYYVVAESGITDGAGNALTTTSFSFTTLNTWSTVGSAGFASVGNNYSQLAFDSTGTPYLVYADSASGEQAIVTKFNGSAWVPIGPAASP